MIETKTHRVVPPAGSSVTRWKDHVDRFDIPVLDAREGGLAERFSAALGGLHPALVFVVVMLAGLAAIAGLSIGFGFLVTHVVEHAWGSGESLNAWLAAHRTGTRTEASLVGSIVAGGVVLPIVAGTVGFVCAVLRKWRLAAFVVFSLGVESAAYRATTLVVHSQRPRVARLESLPVDASYPSGHTAASIAVYAGLVLLLTSRFTNPVLRGFAWTFVLAMVTFVAFARMYRGMHHPIDVLGGVVVGIAALVVLVSACRTAAAAAAARESARARAEGPA
jgi:undecaprenyl-diphosphatase